MVAVEGAGMREGRVERIGWGPTNEEEDRTRQLRGVVRAAGSTLAGRPVTDEGLFG